jgi:ATP-dependent exoDNAse (exonuclease V) alpha subunit
MNNGKTVSFDGEQMWHFDHGYAVTSHSSQGLTAERVLVNIDSDIHPNLLNSRFAYVSISRASHEAHVYTDNAASLGESLSRDVSKSAALDFTKARGWTPEQSMGPKVQNMEVCGFSL